MRARLSNVGGGRPRGRLEAEFSDCAVVLTGTGAVFSVGLDFDHHFPLFARRSLKEIDAWFDAYRATNLRRSVRVLLESIA